jgi:hypothetical protein
MHGAWSSTRKWTSSPSLAAALAWFLSSWTAARDRHVEHALRPHLQPALWGGVDVVRASVGSATGTGHGA